MRNRENVNFRGDGCRWFVSFTCDDAVKLEKEMALSLSPEDEYIVSMVSREMLVSFINRCAEEELPMDLLLVGLEKPLTCPGVGVEYTASYRRSPLAVVEFFDFIDMGFLE